MIKNKNAENSAAAGGGFVVLLLGSLQAHGWNITPADYLTATALVALIPHAVTWFTNWRQGRDPMGVVVKDVGGEHG